MLDDDQPLLTPAPALRAFERALDWFLPEELERNAEAFRRGRLVVASSLVLVIIDLLVLVMIQWTPFTTFQGLILPRPAVAALCLAATAHFTTAFIVKRTARPDSAAFLLVATLIVVFSALAWQSGGFDSPVTWWMAAVPMYSAFLSGPRGTVITSFAVILVIFAFYALHLYIPASRPVLDHKSVADDVLRGQVLLLGFVTFFGWYYEQTRIASSREVVGAYSELERTNSALRMSQLHVRQIAENVGQALWLHDLRTDRVVYANAAFEEVFRVPRAEIAQDPLAWQRRAHEEDRASLPSHLHDGDREYRLMIDGQERWVRHSIYPVGDETTPTHRAIHLVADITLQRTANLLRERYLETVLQVQENERRHLARELHDETGQSLTALLVGLRALANMQKEDQPRQFAVDMADQLRVVVGDLGRLARGLHPSALDELGLVAAVNRLLDDARAAHGVEIELRVSGREREGSLTGTERLTVYRVIQEALTNVARHADARHVDVSLTIEEVAVQFQIEDDGRGFDPKAPPKRHELSSGLGLVSMQERAALMGGEVTIESAPGKGTTVQGILPTGRRRGDVAQA